MNPNCLSYWFPKIEAAGVPVPRTEIVRIDAARMNLVALLDGNEPDGWPEFLAGLAAACRRVGFPCFLRTGRTSGKHDWNDTCFVPDESVLPRHVAALVEFSECADFFGLPWDVWVVRELLRTAPLFTAFRGFPVTREFRCFVDGGRVACIHNYWPEGAIEGHTDEKDWRAKLQKASHLPDDVAGLAESAGAALPGAWSVDVLQDAAGKWWVTDCADAGSSFHWPACVNEKRWPRREGLP